MKLGKKALSIFLVAAMAASMSTLLGGCDEEPAASAGDGTTSAAEGGDEAGGDDAAADDGTTEEEEIHVNPYAGTEYPEGIEVTAWAQNFGDIWLENFEKRVHEYNLEGNGYTIVEEFIAGAAWDERITAARASGTCPDIYMQSYNHIPAGVQNGYYTAYDGLLDQSVIDDMLPIIQDMVQIDGKTYGFPLLCEPSQVLYYRKDLLEAGGYSEPPKTWDELIEMANALKTDEVYGLGIPNWGGEVAWSTWGMQLGNIGHGPLNDNWDAPTILDDDGYREMALFFKELYDTGAVPEQPLGVYTDIKPFGQGDYVFQICGSWAITDLIDKYPEIWENTGVAVMPTNDGNQDKTTATIGGWLYVLDAKSDCPEGACDYLNWLADSEHPERLGDYYVNSKFAKASPFSSIAEWTTTQVEGDADYIEVINHITEYGQPEASYLWDISMSVESLFEDVAMGYNDIDSALQACQDEIQQLINDNQLAGTNPRK